MSEENDVDRAPVHAVVNRRFLLTWKSAYFYRQSETWSIAWRGIKWRWSPEFSIGMGDGGWVFHWFGILVERFCFDADDWGDQKAEDLACIFRAMLEEKSSD
jgi:hypothetical protein